MKYSIFLILLFATVAVSIGIYRKPRQNERWRQHKTAMASLRKYLGGHTLIGMPVDGQHTLDAFEARYWLAPQLVLPGQNNLDTQLFIRVTDEKADRFPDFKYVVDTLWRFDTRDVHYTLVKII